MWQRTPAIEKLTKELDELARKWNRTQDPIWKKEWYRLINQMKLGFVGDLTTKSNK